jgi:excisionase family DNA binding protein
VQDAVDLAIAGPRQPVPDLIAGGGIDRGGAVPGREVVAVGEPGDVGDLDQQPRGAGRADALQVKQLGAGRCDHCTHQQELAVEQYLFNLSEPREDAALQAVGQPNVWLLSAEEIPPILFTTAEVARLLGIGKCRVYDLIRARELRSVKVGASRRVSARALRDYVEHLEMGEPA